MTWRFATSTGCCIDRPIAEALGALRHAGIAAVEIGTPPRHFDPIRPDQVAAVGHHLRAGHMHPVSIHAPFGGALELTDADPHRRLTAIGGVLAAASALRDVGGSKVVVHVSDVPRWNQNVGERLAHAREALTLLARACQQMSLTLVIETPLPHLIGGDPDEFVSVMDGLDRSVGVCFDTAHMTLGGHWDRFVALVGDRLVHVHASDHRGHFDDHLPPGQGIIDWRHIRDSLVQLAFNEWIVLELACPGSPLEAYFHDAMQRAQQLLHRT